ncbi:S-layer domain protein [Gloeothece citriformis PCC 7424]|uniref:S-layer domain protein n=1 Tax=Gloeothece citriformis (strain PCC 7424) TaxID=65393 RepID=B7KJX4_GLOC7|nr:iron uptake porin [Gloeothece citriformis]ACK69573.1 S-layer domain protein [Gloeothece citriformis PCC 7424]
MFTQIGKSLLLSCAVVGSLLVSSVWANDSVSSTNNNSAANSTIPQSPEEIAKAISQLRSIQELRDVDPTNWSYQALRNLVEQYGCIVGYPDRTYRGDRALTRYEFAAGLNACIEALERRILSAQQTRPPQVDIVIDEIRPVAYEDSYEQFADTFNRAFFNRTGKFWDIHGWSGQFNTWLGWRNFPGSFLENDIMRDAKTINIIYRNGQQQQTPLPRLITPDLPTPFNTSVLQNPSYLSGSPVGSGARPEVDIIIQPNPVYP